MMDATQCKQFLTRSLAAESAVLEALNDLLEHEYQHIVEEDIDRLDRTAIQREAYIDKLMKLDADRIAICRAAGKPADRHGLEQLLAWCDPDHSLQSAWRDSAERLQHCRVLNDRNGALVNTRLKRVEGVLDALTGGQSREQRTYSARGTAYQQAGVGGQCNFKA